MYISNDQVKTHYGLKFYLAYRHSEETNGYLVTGVTILNQFMYYVFLIKNLNLMNRKEEF